MVGRGENVDRAAEFQQHVAALTIPAPNADAMLSAAPPITGVPGPRPVPPRLDP